MIAANHHTKGTPPVPAIVVVGVIALATLVSAAGVARGVRWAFRVAMTGRIIDALSNFLGLTNHPTAVTTVGGGVGLVLSIAVRPVRVNPRRAARRALGLRVGRRRARPGSDRGDRRACRRDATGRARRRAESCAGQP